MLESQLLKLLWPSYAEPSDRPSRWAEVSAGATALGQRLHLVTDYPAGSSVSHADLGRAAARPYHLNSTRRQTVRRGKWTTTESRLTRIFLALWVTAILDASVVVFAQQAATTEGTFSHCGS
jgi:hypothetical protein